MSQALKFYIYDLETFRSCFVFNGKFEDAKEVQTFEISARRNDRDKLMQWLSYLQNCGASMVGFNNLAFDYPILHKLLNEPYTFDAQKAYSESQNIIGSQTYGANPNSIPLRERIIPQIDLVKINHFDNQAKRTRLKDLQFAMRSESVEDLPYDPASDLTSEQMDKLISYGIHDITETEKFLKKCKHLIEMRQELLDQGVISGDVLNYSDVKIGVEYLVKKIGRQKCFIGGKPKITPRQVVQFKSIILPKIQFKTEEFQRVHEWFRHQAIIFTSEERPKLEANLAGLEFHFGVGGVHASVESRVFRSNETHVIKDIDVTGMYVSIAIANGFYPEHLGQDFVTAYRQLQKDRAQYPKGTTMNAVLKLAGNGVYGNSNNHWSPFYDPKYTFTVTVNGQLQLLQLAEVLSLIPGLELIQCNTDGITAYVRRDTLHLFDLWCRWWESETGLKLEEVDYKSMHIGDVNNYLCVLSNGKVKRKGRYGYPLSDRDYEGAWNKDYSNLSAQKGAELVMLHGVTAEQAIPLITDPFDFMLRYKTPAGAKVFIGDEEQPKTVRYYVSKSGQPMKKVATPKGEIGQFKRRNGIKDDFYKKVLAEIGPGVWDERVHTKNKSKYETVVTSIESGRLVKQCNHVNKFNWQDVDFDYYAEEIKKLIIGGRA